MINSALEENLLNASDLFQQKLKLLFIPPSSEFY